jgi:hypothetical protein
MGFSHCDKAIFYMKWGKNILFFSFSSLIFSFALLRCAKEVAPEWITFEQMIDRDRAFVSAVVSVHPSISVARVKCDTEAKTKLKFVLQAELKDVFGGLIKQNEEAFLRKLSEDLAKELIEKTEVQETFIDEKKGVLYCRIFLYFTPQFYSSAILQAEAILKNDFPDVFNENIKHEMIKRLEEKRGIKLNQK